jgi:hypothetical protein
MGLSISPTRWRAIALEDCEPVCFYGFIKMGRRLAIRAAAFGPEADFRIRTVDELTAQGIDWTRKNEGA